MYRAKATGKARYVLFDAELHSEASRRLRLEADLRQAVQHGHLSAVYQPVYELASGRLTGFEALARWTHPERGEVGPDTFIPVAEDSGLMVAVTDLMLRMACRQLKEWQEQNPRFAELTVQVNLSGKDLAHGSVSERVTHAITQAGVLPRHLTLELTENILMESIETALPQLNRLRDLGVHLCVDDFGTAYSSLSHLARLPIDGLKVDRSFVRNLSVASKDAMVVLGIVHLGQSLGKVVVAEGIETVSQFEQLRGMGCHSGQGFLMSRPLSGEAAGALLQQLQDGQSHALAGAALSAATVLH
jgi:EAL domain-containing protein (putative c-di-GMP-specific phosphodiesterase class I)